MIGVLSAIAWLRKLSRFLSQHGPSVVDYFQLARDPGATGSRQDPTEVTERRTPKPAPRWLQRHQ
jgi:hypothetical protein